LSLFKPILERQDSYFSCKTSHNSSMAHGH